MNEKWNNAIVTEVSVAIYVAPGTGSKNHKNRPFHGLVINDDGSDKDYLFSDGTTLHTGGNDVFYLPKGSNYDIISNIPSGCYAINFDLLYDPLDKPFILHFRNSDAVLKAFKEAVLAWQQQAPDMGNVVIKNIYEIIIQCKNEEKRNYVPSSHEQVLRPALDEIALNFTKNDLMIENLARLCNVSTVYFRRLFSNKYGVSPKEYITNLRINYAKRLLESDQFSVGEVATLCGYAEPCHFSREFSKRIGTSPSKYRADMVIKS